MRCLIAGKGWFSTIFPTVFLRTLLFLRGFVVFLYHGNGLYIIVSSLGNSACKRFELGKTDF